MMVLTNVDVLWCHSTLEIEKWWQMTENNFVVCIYVLILKCLFYYFMVGLLYAAACILLKIFAKKLQWDFSSQIQPFWEILSAVWCGCSYIFSVDLALIFQHAMVVTIFLWHVHIFTTNGCFLWCSFSEFQK